jgi:hypothetical protein
MTQAMRTPTTPKLTHVLLGLLRLSAPSTDAGGMVALAPLGDMLAAALVGAAGERSGELLDALASASASVGGLPTAEEQPYRVLEYAGRDDLSAALHAEALAASARTIDEALLIALVAGARPMVQAQVSLGNLAIFDYIVTLAVEPRPGEPLVVLVGSVPESLGRLRVAIPGRQLQLRKIDLSYTREGPYPHLDVWLPSVCGERELQISRTGWVQPENADLELYNHNLAYFGRIHTTRAALPYCVEGARITLTIPAATSASPLVTHILDGAGRELAHIVKVVPE